MTTSQEFGKQEFLRFEDGALREGAALDRAIFWAGTGTLVLSVNYIIGLKDTPLIFPLILISAWIFLLLSIIAQIFGYKFSKTFHIKVLKNIKSWAREGFPSAPRLSFENEETDKYHKWANKLTDASLYFLMAGLLLITIFTIVNFLIYNKFECF